MDADCSASGWREWERERKSERLCLVFEQIFRLFFVHGACIIIIYLKIFMFKRMISLQFPEKKDRIFADYKRMYTQIFIAATARDKCLPYFAKSDQWTQCFFLSSSAICVDFFSLSRFYDDFLCSSIDRSRCRGGPIDRYTQVKNEVAATLKCRLSSPLLTLWLPIVHLNIGFFSALLCFGLY